MELNNLTQENIKLDSNLVYYLLNTYVNDLADVYFETKQK